MAYDTFTKKVDGFFDNNTPGGYITTSVSISNSDLDVRINQAINNKGFLTSTSHISWNNIDNKPTLFSGSYNDLTNKPILFSGSYNDLTNKPNIPTISISNTLNEGTRLATISINGINTDIYSPIIANENTPENIEESDPIFIASPAATITNEDILIWNNKSDLDSNTLASIAFTANYSDLINYPVNIDGQRQNFAAVAFTGDYYNLTNAPTTFTNTINFSSYTNSTVSSTENAKMANLGTTDTYILDFSGFIDNNNAQLIERVSQLSFLVMNNNQSLILHNDLYDYLVTNVRARLDPFSEELWYVILDFCVVNEDNYTNIVYTENNFDSTIANTQLNNLTLSSSCGVLIFDYFNDVIYCKKKIIT